MGTLNSIKTSAKVFAALCVTGSLLVSCLDKQDVYDPNAGKNNIPVENLPDFTTTSEVSLDVDYEVPGRKVLVQIFTEDPFILKEDGSVLQKDPVFAAFTDDNAKLTTKFVLPTAVKQVYVCCPTMGMQSCVSLNVVNNSIDFKASTAKTKGFSTRTEASFKPSLRTVDESRNLYAFCNWDSYGKPDAGYYTPSNSTNEMITWLQKILWKGSASKPSGLNNSQWVKDEKVTNITILKRMKNEQGVWVDVENAAVTLTFVSEGAWFQDVFGYYFYPTDQKPTDLSKLKKYIAMPNVSKSNHQPYGSAGDGGLEYDANKAPLQGSQKVTLWYVDENGTVHEKFPAGYTIGWFVIPNGFTALPAEASGKINSSKGFLYSNNAWNAKSKGCCISLTYDGKVIVGIEDSNSDASYEDLLFYVDADPSAAIYDPERPNVDEDGDITSTDKVTGSYAFEDQWPSKGDYDLNDVVIEYERATTFRTDNKVLEVKDTFKPVQRPGSASYRNAFAYQIDPAQVGEYTLPDGAIYEESTHSFIIFPDATLVKDKSFTITRKFTSPSFTKTEMKSYNPFIIVNYQKGAEKRTEVHLPKKKPTSLADESLNRTKDDAYYIDVDGKHPFAIDIPIWNFIQPKEKNMIDNEYPSFSSWVNGGCGTVDADWYTKHKE